MPIYRNEKYGITVEVPRDATPEQVGVQMQRAEEEHIRAAKSAKPSAPGMEALEEFLGPAPTTTPAEGFAGELQRRIGGALGGATAGGLFGPAGMAGGALLGAATGAEPLEAIGDIVGAAGPSIAGAQAGQLAGGRLGPAGGVAGGAIGGLLGELLAQKTGVAPKSELGLAGAALPIPATATARGVVTRLPGAAKGISQAAKPLWETAEALATKAKVMIRPTNVAAAAAKLKPETFAEFATSGMKRLIKSGTRVGEKFTIPFKEFRDELTLLGRRVGSLARQGGPEYGQAKELYKAMQKDLEAAIKTAPPELKPLLQKATKLSRQATSSEKMGRAGTGITTRAVLGGGGYAYGGPAGALAAVAPDIIKAGLETPAGRRTIATLASQGADLDQIVNALVQLGVKAGQSGVEERGSGGDYVAPWGEVIP